MRKVRYTNPKNLQHEVHIEVIVKSTAYDLSDIVDKIEREAQLSFGDNASIGYVEVRPG